MTVNPPYSLEGKDPDDLPDLPVSIDTVQDCDCPWGEGPYAGEGECYPTTVKSYDKWWLKQCQNCGGLWWVHNARADYGIPEMDNR